MITKEQEPNIREYNFAIPGNTQRHIPGIPGIWPFGSIVFLDEGTMQVVKTIPEGAMAMVPKPVEEEKPTVTETTTVEPETPPALQSEQVQQGG